MRARVLSKEQIEEAKELREKEKWSNRKIARHFGVAKSTIWDNVFAGRRRTRRITPHVPREISYRDLRCVIIVVVNMREREMNSLEIAEKYELPLEEVNAIFSRPPVLYHSLIWA